MNKNNKIFLTVEIIIAIVIIDIVYSVFFMSESKNAPVKTNNEQTTSMANPASVNCTKQGGNLVIKTRGDGGQYGLCYFEDNRACEEWALMKGECPIGGRKTTGYDTEAQNFCAWSGGETFAVENAVCTFKDGSTCLDEDFYNGKCQKGQNKQ